MNKRAHAALLAVCGLALIEGFAVAAGRVAVIPLTEPRDIRDAAAMSKAVDAMSNDVMKCVRDKLAPASKCSCLYPKELARVKEVYEDTITRHPGWQNKAVSYTLDGRTGVVSFGGLKRQFAAKCP